jgi:hypothetical protein
MKKLSMAVLFFVSAVFCFAQNSWLSLGGRLGGSTHFYKLGSDMYEGYDVENPHFSFDGAVQAAVHISDIFAIQTELLFTKDMGSVSEPGYDVKLSIESTSMLIPFLVKASFWSGNFVVSGITGIYFTIPLGDMKVKISENGYSESYDADFKKAPPGFMVGASGGIKLGPGNLLADLRYATDFGETEGSFEGETVSLYKRSMFMFSLGYEIGLLSKGGGGVAAGGSRRRR